MATSPTGIELTTKHFILNFLIVIFPLVINIDGQDIKGKWGTQFYPAQAGNRTITVSWKAYWFLPVNKATMTVSLADGQTSRLQYYAPWLLFLPGKLGPTPAA
ncbi:MAG: hypothetical protein ACYDH6_16685 [Acidimicrobiales bacterium]